MSTSLAPIAIVDDDAPVRRALGRLLRSEGLVGQEYAGAAEFLASLPSGRPACLVLDLHMPGIDGLELQRGLSRDWPGIPVIFVTGQNSPETEAAARAMHPVAYLLKPIDGESLIRAIRSIVG